MLSATKFAAESASDAERLEALDRYDILDTPAEDTFDRITRLVCRVFDVGMSTITFIDGHRQWFKSRQGIADSETGRQPAICNYAIREEHALVIPDTLLDPRFAENPFVIGKPFIRFYAGAPLRSADGQAIGTLCAIDKRARAFGARDLDTLIDLSGIVMNELELRLLATTDGLTGTLSRRAFRDEANRAVSLALRHGHSLGLVMFDLDHFKSVNDRYGHPMGDRVLRQTAEACAGVLRKSDLLGRVGGEEFAVLLPHTGQAQTLEVAEKLRAAIAAQVFITAADPLTATASFGISHLDRSVGDVDELLRRGDVALYAAKSSGRNKCVEWRSEKVSQPGLRRRVLKAGSITFNAGASVIDCTVRSLSDSGASIDVISTLGVPKTFKLRIDADGLSRLCRVTRQEARSLEVEFQ